MKIIDKEERLDKLKIKIQRKLPKEHYRTSTDEEGVYISGKHGFNMAKVVPKKNKLFVEWILASEHEKRDIKSRLKRLS